MAYECELLTGLSGMKTFIINEAFIQLEDMRMQCNEITGFAYGITDTSVNGIHANTEYYFRFLDSAGKLIKFSFVNSALMSPNPAEAPERITTELWLNFGNRLLLEMTETLIAGKTIRIGDLTIHNKGIVIPYKPIFGKNREYDVPWNEMQFDLEGGNLIVNSVVEKKAKKMLFLSRDINAHLLWSLLKSISGDADFSKRIQGK